MICEHLHSSKVKLRIFGTIGFSVNCSPFYYAEKFHQSFTNIDGRKEPLSSKAGVFFSFSFIIIYYEIHPGNARIRKGNGNEYLCPNEAW